MSLTQFQIIQSLGKNLEWLQTELSWGTQAQELRHLIGRIGELYTAMITYGQMAPENNQRGYDVVSHDGERISVKTITSSTHVNFNKATFEFVDRIIILRVNASSLEIEIILNETVEEFLMNSRLRSNDKNYSYPITLGERLSVMFDSSKLEVVNEVQYEVYDIKQYENGTILVYKNGEQLDVAKPILREIANALDVSLFNGTGALKNTRQLGDHIIKAIKEQDAIEE